MIRICCSPFSRARQPGPLLTLKTDSTGKLGSSDVTSTVAICSRSTHLSGNFDSFSFDGRPAILFGIPQFSPRARVAEPRSRVTRAISGDQQRFVFPPPSLKHRRSPQAFSTPNVSRAFPVNLRDLKFRLAPDSLGVGKR